MNIIIKLCVLVFAFMAFTVSAQETDPCKVYDSLKGSNEQLLQLACSAHGSQVDVLVLGTPKYLLPTFNGINVRKNVEKIDSIICHNKRAGEIRHYNLSGLNIESGVFTIQSGKLKASTKVDMPKNR